MVAVAQPVEHFVVAEVVARSSRVGHPFKNSLLEAVLILTYRSLY